MGSCVIWHGFINPEEVQQLQGFGNGGCLQFEKGSYKSVHEKDVQVFVVCMSS